MAVDAVTVARALGGVVLLFANGFFVTTEFAMTRVPQFDAEQFTGSRGLERAWTMTERLEIYLSGCQVGITVASVGLGVVAEPALTAIVNVGLGAVGVGGGGGGAGHTTASVLFSLAVINLLHVVVGEQAPTYLGVERTRFVAKYGATPLYYWTKLMSPVIVVADQVAKSLLGLFGVTVTRSWHDAEEGGGGGGTDEGAAAEGRLSRGALRREIGKVLSRGRVSSERRREVLNALEIGQRPVEEIAVPREEVVALSTTDDVGTNLERIRSNRQHVRFPLVGEDLDDFRGVVYLPTVMANLDALEAGEADFEALAAPPVSVRTDAPISAVIDRLQAENAELALVRDPVAPPGAATGAAVAGDGGDDAPVSGDVPEGRVVGLVTISDAFEAIAGEVEDPIDAGEDDRPVGR